MAQLHENFLQFLYGHLQLGSVWRVNFVLGTNNVSQALFMRVEGVLNHFEDPLFDLMQPPYI